MSRFSKFLESINKKLDLPQPDKSRILLEISADLNDLFETYLERGMDEEVAQKRAEEKFYPSESSLKQLVDIHQSPFRKLINRLSGRVLNRWEKGILGLIVITLIYSALRLILNTPFFHDASIFIYPVTAFFLVAALLALIKFYQIFLKKDHKIQSIRNGMDTLLVLSFTCLVLGIFGYFFELFYAGQYALLFDTKLIYIIQTTDANFDEILSAITFWMVKSSALLIYSFITSLISISAWFFILNKIINIEQAEVEFQINS